MAGPVYTAKVELPVYTIKSCHVPRNGWGHHSEAVGKQTVDCDCDNACEGCALTNRTASGPGKNGEAAEQSEVQLLGAQSTRLLPYPF